MQPTARDSCKWQKTFATQICHCTTRCTRACNIYDCSARFQKAIIDERGGEQKIVHSIWNDEKSRYRVLATTLYWKNSRKAHVKISLLTCITRIALRFSVKIVCVTFPFIIPSKMQKTCILNQFFDKNLFQVRIGNLMWNLAQNLFC